MKAAVVTVSDRVSRGEADDRSGPAARDRLIGLGFEVSAVQVVPDGVVPVGDALARLVGTVGLVVTSGGTGFSVRDVTPEATAVVVERPAPGLAEAMPRSNFRGQSARDAVKGSCRNCGDDADHQPSRLGAGRRGVARCDRPGAEARRRVAHRCAIRPQCPRFLTGSGSLMCRAGTSTLRWRTE